MRFESIPGDGAVGVSELRRALGPAALLERAVTVTALGNDGTVVTAVVELMDKPAGRGLHRCFACPSCGSSAAVLRVAQGSLACARCRPHRTAHQRQWFTRWWRQFDGKVVDQLIRLGLRRSATHRLERMNDIVNHVVSRDRARLDALARDVTAFHSSSP